MGDTSKDQKITGYWLNYQTNKDLVRIWVTTESNTNWTLVNETEPGNASFIRNMLESGADVFITEEQCLYIKKSIGSSPEKSEKSATAKSQPEASKTEPKKSDDSSGSDSSGPDSSGTNSSGTNSSETNSSGTNSSGTNSSGTNSSGLNSSETDSARQIRQDPIHKELTHRKMIRPVRKKTFPSQTTKADKPSMQL